MDKRISTPTSRSMAAITELGSKAALPAIPVSTLSETSTLHRAALIGRVTSVSIPNTQKNSHHDLHYWGSWLVRLAIGHNPDGTARSQVKLLDFSLRNCER